jgi:two-component system chemotaxis response regulator CheB
LSAGARQRDVVVIGASAGGVETLSEIVEGLPTEFPGSVLIVLHVLATGTSVLDLILTRAGNLPAVAPFDGEPVHRGQIYVAPPDQHMLLKGERISLSRGPRENGHRPAIDPLFRSAARSAGSRVIGVVLSGALDDGAGGLQFVKKCGGLTIVQDPADALYPSMPEHAIAAAAPDYVVPANEISAILSAEIERVPTLVPLADDSDVEPDLFEAYPADILVTDGPPTGLTCPECGGALWEETDGALIRFACHVGHSYSAESLVSEQGQALESALWSGLRALEERADLLERMSRRSERSTRSAGHFRTRAQEAREHALALRALLTRLGRDIAPGPELAGEPQ